MPVTKVSFSHSRSDLLVRNLFGRCVHVAGSVAYVSRGMPTPPRPPPPKETSTVWATTMAAQIMTDRQSRSPRR
jgi:hypothetical protein